MWYDEFVPGSLEAQDDADRTLGDFGRHVLEAGPMGETARRDADAVQDGDGIAPAEGDGLVAEARPGCRCARRGCESAGLDRRT